jgi:hypothetical protein
MKCEPNIFIDRNGNFIIGLSTRVKTHPLPVKRQPRRCRGMTFSSDTVPLNPGPPFLHEVIGKIKSGIYDLGLGLDGIHNSYDIAPSWKMKVDGQKSDSDLQPSTFSLKT